MDDWFIRTSVVLAALAPPDPKFANSQSTENVAPGAKLVELREMFVGKRSDVGLGI